MDVVKWFLLIWVLTADGEMDQKVGIANIDNFEICDMMGERMTRYLVDIKDYSSAMFSCKHYDPSETDPDLELDLEPADIPI